MSTHDQRVVGARLSCRESAHQSVDDVFNLGVADARALSESLPRDVLVHSQRRDDSAGVHRRVPVAEPNVPALTRREPLKVGGLAQCCIPALVRPCDELCAARREPPQQRI